MNITVLIYDAFSTVPGKGNPAGVVIDAVALSASRMQSAARFLGFNESAFVLPSDKADFRLRYFTPGNEVPLCGHATIAAVYAMFEKGILLAGNYSVETGEGILQVSLNNNDQAKVLMQQGVYRELRFSGDLKKLAESIGLQVDELDTSLPVMYGCTGLWTLLVPVRSLNSFRKMKPQNELFPDILTELPRASVHPFCLETYSPDCLMHGRHFSSPFSRTIEDPVTGTASGVMGAYYAKYISSQASRVIIEQGTESNKSGIVEVYVPENLTEPVTIAGTAVFVSESTVVL